MTINENYAILSCNEYAECHSGTYCYEAKPVSGASLQHGRPHGTAFFIQKKMALDGKEYEKRYH